MPTSPERLTGDAAQPRAQARGLRARMEELRWYHTIDLGEGVVTPGFFDHRPYVRHYELPGDLSGTRALDVGLQDGFWGFELERRGANVVGIDLDSVEQLDWPPRLREEGVSREGGGFPLAHGAAFSFAREALGSAVERVPLSAYDASPERIGSFDLVFVGSMLVHLRDPMLALERLASVCRGRLVLCEPYSRRLGPFAPAGAEFLGEAPWMTWWQPNVKGWTSMIRCAGFEEVRVRSRFSMRFADQRGGVRHVVLHARGGG